MHGQVSVARRAEGGTCDEEKNADELRVEEENRIEALRQQTEHLLNDFRMDYLEQRLRDLKRDISLAVNDPERLQQLMEEYKTAHELRSQLAGCWEIIL